MFQDSPDPEANLPARVKDEGDMRIQVSQDSFSLNEEGSVRFPPWMRGSSH